MAEPALMRFTETDEFLRRVSFHNHFRHEVLYWQAFKEKDPRMSWTFRNDELGSDAGIDAYHAYFSKSFGQSLPAILRFTYHGLTQRIDPPLEPRHDPDADDPIYGHLHCSTDPPHDKAHMQRLAKLVNDGIHASVAKRHPKAVL